MCKNKGKKTVLTACSDGIGVERKEEIQLLIEKLSQMGILANVGECLYDRGDGHSGTPKERAQMLMKSYENVDNFCIFDVSGGNLANEILRYLDYNKIKECKKPFVGYSDLTVILNAIYAKTGNPGVLYQVRNLLYADKIEQERYVKQEFIEQKPWKHNWTFYQGLEMEGIVVGGNIRCFLKLAGTEYFPNLQDKLLLLEARSGDVTLMLTYLNQLEQIGAFQKIAGVLLGTFSQLEKQFGKDKIMELILPFCKQREIPIAKTQHIGHGEDAKGIWIGRKIKIKKTDIC